MRILSKQPVKYDLSLFIVLLLIKKSEISDAVNYFSQHSLLYTFEKANQIDGVFTLRCTEEQLTMVILHFG